MESKMCLHLWSLMILEMQKTLCKSCILLSFTKELSESNLVEDLTIANILKMDVLIVAPEITLQEIAPSLQENNIEELENATVVEAQVTKFKIALKKVIPDLKEEEERDLTVVQMIKEEKDLTAEVILETKESTKETNVREVEVEIIEKKRDIIEAREANPKVIATDLIQEIKKDEKSTVEEGLGE